MTTEQENAQHAAREATKKLQNQPYDMRVVDAGDFNTIAPVQTAEIKSTKAKGK